MCVCVCVCMCVYVHARARVRERERERETEGVIHSTNNRNVHILYNVLVFVVDCFAQAQVNVIALAMSSS